MTARAGHKVYRWPGKRTVCTVCAHVLIPVSDSTAHPSCDDGDGTYSARRNPLPRKGSGVELETAPTSANDADQGLTRSSGTNRKEGSS